jgi:hypothetical protein
MRTRWSLSAAFAALLLFSSGCVVGRATGSMYEIPRERATECQDICSKLDLQMAAVVVIMNTTGCVCEPKGARPTGQPGTAQTGGSAAATAAEVMAAQAAQQQRASR